MLSVLAMLAHGTPPAPLAPPVVQRDESVGSSTELREELRALRQALDEERTLREAMLEELRASRPRPRSTSSRTRMGAPAVVEAGQEVEELVAFGDDVLVHGTVRGNATSFGGNVQIGSTGVVLGDAVSFGGRVHVAPGGEVHGDRVGLASMDGFEEVEEGDGWVTWLYHRTLLALTLLGAGVLVVGLFPDRVGTISRQVARTPVSSGFVGAAFASLTVVFSVLFMLLTLGLGTPVSAVGIALLGAAWLVGFVAVCQVVGDRLPMAAPNGRWVALVAGALLFAFGGSLGLGGTLLAFMVSMLGIGAAVSSRFGAVDR